MKPIIEGATALVKVQSKKEDGSLAPISGYEMSGEWIGVPGAMAPTPTETSVDTYSWIVSAPTDGLGGRIVDLRLKLVDPATGIALIEDVRYQVKK